MSPADADPADRDDADAEEPAHARAIHAGIALGVTVIAVVLSVALSIPGLLLGVDTVAGFVTSVVGGELGYVVAGLVFLIATDRGVAYLDLELPASRRAWGVVAAVVLGTFLFRTGALAGALEVGVEPAGPSVAAVDLPFEVLVAILVPASLLVIGPAEELLFRGVLQKYLRETLSERGAILIAGALFGVIHVLTFVEATPLGVVFSLSVITLVGLAFGWLYERTGSLPAAMVAHGTYNALIVATGYLLEVA